MYTTCNKVNWHSRNIHFFTLWTNFCTCKPVPNFGKLKVDQVPENISMWFDFANEWRTVQPSMDSVKVHFIFFVKDKIGAYTFKLNITFMVTNMSHLLRKETLNQKKVSKIVPHTIGKLRLSAFQWCVSWIRLFESVSRNKHICMANHQSFA